MGDWFHRKLVFLARCPSIIVKNYLNHEQDRALLIPLLICYEVTEAGWELQTCPLQRPSVLDWISSQSFYGPHSLRHTLTLTMGMIFWAHDIFSGMFREVESRIDESLFSFGFPYAHGSWPPRHRFKCKYFIWGVIPTNTWRGVEK